MRESIPLSHIVVITTCLQGDGNYDPNHVEIDTVPISRLSLELFNPNCICYTIRNSRAGIQYFRDWNKAAY